MHLKNSNYEYIKQEIVNLYINYNVNQLPIDIFTLISNLNIEIFTYSASSIISKELESKMSQDGFYLFNLNQEMIFYNDLKSPERIRMTLFHEVAHSVLGHSNNMSQDFMEAEANFFAKYAIAPPPVIMLVGAKTPDDIRKIFGTSNQAANYIFNYYNKWLEVFKVNNCYLTYERDLLRLFKNNK